MNRKKRQRDTHHAIGMQRARQVFQILCCTKIRVESVYVLLGISVIRATRVANLFRDRRNPDGVKAHALYTPKAPTLVLELHGENRGGEMRRYLDVRKMVDDSPPRPAAVSLEPVRT